MLKPMIKDVALSIMPGILFMVMVIGIEDDES